MGCRRVRYRYLPSQLAPISDLKGHDFSRAIKAHKIVTGFSRRGTVSQNPTPVPAEIVTISVGTSTSYFAPALR